MDSNSSIDSDDKQGGANDTSKQLPPVQLTIGSVVRSSYQAEGFLGSGSGGLVYLVPVPKHLISRKIQILEYVSPAFFGNIFQIFDVKFKIPNKKAIAFVKLPTRRTASAQVL